MLTRVLSLRGNSDWKFKDRDETWIICLLQVPAPSKSLHSSQVSGSKDGLPSHLEWLKKAWGS